MAEYKLFYKPTCPYCKKVLKYMDMHDINIDLANILEGDNQEKLIEKGGSRQVPALSIDGEIMYESQDIISYMHENFVKEK